jgi:acyl carrier protein
MEAQLKELNEIFADVLDIPSLTLTEQTTAKDIAEWDSLSHIHLVVAIEERFRIRFNSSEIQTWKNVGDMVRSIQNKVNPK